MTDTLFSKKLLQWHTNTNARIMPWKEIKNPYFIWLSEIILQQTKVAQGWKYYELFTTKYPTIHHLAKANDEEVFKCWEGLGYYNRCRNLLFTARYIVTHFDGVFPTDYDTLLTLKGIGKYTAAAIASFAYNLPHAVVDGNVVRVLARVYGIKEDNMTTTGQKLFEKRANDLLDKKNAAKYNQAIMDYGATVCIPANPVCNTCIFKKTCIAFTTDTIAALPFKKKKIALKERYFHFFIFMYKNQILIQKRVEGDIWKDLYQFYTIENTNETLEKKLYEHLHIKLPKPVIASQKLSHQHIKASFYTIVCDKKPRFSSAYQWVPLNELQQYSFPTVIREFVQKLLNCQ